MVRYIVSVKPEFRTALTPESLVETIDRISGLRIVEGRGRWTITVEARSEAWDRITSALPGASVRLYQPLALLR